MSFETAYGERGNSGADSGSYADLAVGDGHIAGNLTVAGNITNLQLHGPYAIQRNNTGGISYATLRSTSQHICFLTRVALEDLDSGGEVGECRLNRVGGNWRLNAALGPTGDSDAWCEAYCLGW